MGVALIINLVILEGLKPVLGTIKKAINQMSQKRSIQNIGLCSTFGESVNHAGRRNLQLLEILDDIMKISSERIDQSLYDQEFYHQIPQIIFNFPWHNVLHNIVSNQLTLVIEKSEFPLLESQLFDENNSLLKAIVEGFKNGRVNVAGEKSYTKGFIAPSRHLTRIIMQSTKPHILNATETYDDWQEYLKQFMFFKELEDQNLGGFQIRERTIQENFDFTMEDITSRYSDFLQRAETNSDSVSSEDHENSPGGQPKENTTPSYQGSEFHSTDGRPKNDNSLDEWLNGIIEKKEIIKHQEENIHDNISKEFNDSNYWKNAVMPEKHSEMLDDLLNEVNI